MKVIDLLNKIANGEEVPKKIKYDKSVFKYDEEELDYFSDGYSSLFQLCCCLFLNDEVEIIEEDNKIKTIKTSCKEGEPMTLWTGAEIEIIEKVNELIDEVNKLKEKQ